MPEPIEPAAVKLKKPQSWNEWADFVSKTALSLAALLVTLGTAWLGHTERQRSEADAKYYQAQEREMKKQTLVLQTSAESRQGKEAANANIKGLLDYVPTDSNDPKARAKLRMLADSCGDSTQPGYGTSSFIHVCEDITATGKALLAGNAESVNSAATAAVTNNASIAFLNSDSVAVQNAGLNAAESVNPTKASTRWYAVVASLPLSSASAVQGLTQQLNQKLMGAGLPNFDVHVYRTKISKSYALTSGQDKTEAEARARVKMLRQAGIKDAFAQPDRDWVKADELRR